MRTLTLRTLVTLFLIISAIPNAHLQAQTFEDVVFGAKHKCGFLPDGTSKIYVNNNGNFEAVDSAAALNEIAILLADARKRVRQLTNVKKDLSDSDFKSSSLGILRRTLKDLEEDGYQGKKKVGKTRKERIALTKSLIKFAEEKANYYELYLRGLETCRDNFRKGTLGNVAFKVVSLGDGSRWRVNVLLLIPRPLSGKLKNVEQLAYCVRPVKDAFGTGDRGYMSSNPCDYFNVNQSCTQLFDSDLYAARFYTGTEYGGRPSDEAIAGRIAEYNSIYGAGFVGRQQGDGIHTSNSAEADRCDDF